MTQASELATVPGVIPYVDHHDGPRRMLSLEISTVRPAGIGIVSGFFAPVVGIDGRQYLVPFGSVSFEIPADRNVHISVQVQSGRGEMAMMMAASVILPPNPASVRLAPQLAMGGGGGFTPLG